MIRVVNLISGLMYGGGQRIAVDLFEQTRQSGKFAPSLMLLGCLEPGLARLATKVISYDGRFNRISTLLATASRLRTVLAVEAPSILHTHGWDADVIGWLATRGTQIRQIVHLHVTASWLTTRGAKHKLRRRLTRAVFKGKETRVIACCEAVRHHWASLLPWPLERIITVPNSVNIERFRPLSVHDTPTRPNEVVLGTAARLAPMKGLDHMLSALARLQDRGFAPACHIAGDGPLRSELEGSVRKLGLGERVRFLGHVHDMTDFYRSIDMFVLPSVSDEGLPISLLEAMATRLPTIATAVGGSPEAIADRQNGLLVPPGNAESLADAIESLLSCPELRNICAKEGYGRVIKQFNIELFADRIFDIYDDMISA